MGRGGPSGLADVLDVLLDKGLVIDAFVRVSLVGIELLTIDARVVVASVDTYLRFAEAVNRLDLLQVNNSQTLGDLVGAPKKENGDSAPSALSSRAEPEPAKEEPSGDGHAQQRDEPAAPENPPHENDDGVDDDKGLLTRIKERGQVF
ncbi:MAG TPA: gas vesicle protein GvpJ [Actinomycetota bacterium]|nr:gas vesicle protein GvpJ [Actinomycetota bacterium]